MELAEPSDTSDRRTYELRRVRMCAASSPALALGTQLLLFEALTIWMQECELRIEVKPDHVVAVMVRWMTDASGSGNSICSCQFHEETNDMSTKGVVTLVAAGIRGGGGVRDIAPAWAASSATRPESRGG